jgi:NTE family protein
MGLYKGKEYKIGLALGTGAARGICHIGVIKALLEEGIVPDFIAGTSMGALVGAAYARKGEIASVEQVALQTDWRKLWQLADPNLALLQKGLIPGDKVKELLLSLVGDIEFKDLQIPLAVIACDINTAEEAIIREGNVVEAVRASISLPGIFVPQKLGGRFLMDGGIVNPVPIDVVRQMGADFIIACNSIPPILERSFSLRAKKKKETRGAEKQKPVSQANAWNKKINSLIAENKVKLENFQKQMAKFFKKGAKKARQTIDPDTPDIFTTLMQTLFIMEYEIAKAKIKAADILITPKTGHIEVMEFQRAKELIAEGYKAAKASLK